MDVLFILNYIDSYKFRLVHHGATETEGRLEVRPDNLPWGRIVLCDNRRWDRIDESPNAVCRYLGHEYGGFFVHGPYIQSAFTNNTDIHLSRIDCEESNLDMCIFKPWNVQDCGIYRTFFVVCTAGNYFLFEMLLILERLRKANVNSNVNANVTKNM